MQYVFGDYTLDTQRRQLRCRGHVVPLQPQVFDVLVYLVTHHDRAVSKQELQTNLWPHLHVSPTTLSAGIKRARQAVGDSGVAQRVIQTLHGRGYRFVAAVEERDAASLAVETPTSTPPAGALAAVADAAGPAVPHAHEEYKPVSILCGALADAPALAAALDPEGLYRRLQTMWEVVQAVLQQYAGTLLPHASGEGFTAVFGAPVVQEDHARRAVLVALEVHERLRQVPSHPELTLSMGIHSGLVMVGGLWPDPHRLVTVVGAATQGAMRLQQQAAPGQILVSVATFHLVQEEVRGEVSGSLALDGRQAPLTVYAVQGLVRRQAGVPQRAWRSRSPFVGRQRELALLHDRLTAAVAGQGQMVGLVGEPGMGKTRLLTEFCQSLAGQPVTVYEGQCLSYGQATPYLPVRDLLRQVCGIGEGDAAAARTAAVQQWLHASGITVEADGALLLQLLDLPVAPECLEQRSPQARQARTFALLRHLILHTAQRQPLVLVVENLHWSDATSAAWLASLVERLAGAAILLLGTYRPGYQPPWGTHSATTQMALAPLRAQDSRTVVQAVLGSVTLPEAQLRAMVAHAGGNPFFLEELAWHVVGQAQPETPGALPETVHAVLAARMDRLPPTAKRLLQVAAVIGMEVSFPLLHAIAEQPEEHLQQRLAHLQAAEFLYETHLFPDLVYTFKHALTQEVAYQSLLKSTRQQLHQCIAQVLETRFPTMVETQPAVLAHHYTEADCHAQAIPYWQRAGQQAIERSAYMEARAHLTKGLEMLQTLPDTPERAQHELAIQLALGTAWRITEGYAAPEAADAMAGARELCRRVGDTSQLIEALWGVGVFYQHQGDLQTAQALFEQRLPLAEALHDPVLLARAHIQLGACLFFLGAIASAHAHLTQAITLCTRQQDRAQAFVYSQDDMGQCFGYATHTLWMLGYPDQALTQYDAMFTQAQASADAFTQARALFYAASSHTFRREGSAAQERAEAALALMTAQGLRHLTGAAMCMRGWALAAQGQCMEAIALLHQGLAAEGGTESVLGRSIFLAMLGEAYGASGQAEEGLRLLAEALVHVEHTGERFWEAEVYRLKGEILQAVSDVPQAETCFQRALTVAHCQQAKSLELRAAMSLSRLWQRQGKHQAAYDLLAPIYGWFTEGFDTPDLQEARALLEELS